MDINAISSFFNKNVGRENEAEKFWNSLSFIATNEWHWSQKDLCEADIPYVLALLESREKHIKEMNKKR